MYHEVEGKEELCNMSFEIVSGLMSNKYINIALTSPWLIAGVWACDEICACLTVLLVDVEVTVVDLSRVLNGRGPVTCDEFDRPFSALSACISRFRV